jgi:acyl-CoA thioesterase I
MLFGLLGAFGLLFVGAAQAATVVAPGASITYGKGISRGQACPAQLEALLRARGLNARVINAGINGNTTSEMLARLNSAVQNGTSVVILQPGGNDRRKSAPDQTAEIETRLAAMGVKVILLPNGMPPRVAASARRAAPDPGRLSHAGRTTRGSGGQCAWALIAPRPRPRTAFSPHYGIFPDPRVVFPQYHIKFDLKPENG